MMESNIASRGSTPSSAESVRTRLCPALRLVVSGLLRNLQGFNGILEARNGARSELIPEKNVKEIQKLSNNFNDETFFLGSNIIATSTAPSLDH